MSIDPRVIVPYNGFTGKPYEGKNGAQLTAVAVKRKYTDPRWVTFRQGIQLGYVVKKGEKSTRIVFVDPKALKKDGSVGLVFKGYNVFNLMQCQKVTKEEAQSVCVVEDNLPQLVAAKM